MTSLDTIRRRMSDESEYEPRYAYGKEIYEDFMFNVGRKIQILKSSIKVLVHSSELHSFYSIIRSGPVLLVHQSIMRRS